MGASHESLTATVQLPIAERDKFTNAELTGNCQDGHLPGYSVNRGIALPIDNQKNYQNAFAPDTIDVFLNLLKEEGAYQESCDCICCPAFVGTRRFNYSEDWVNPHVKCQVRYPAGSLCRPGGHAL